MIIEEKELGQSRNKIRALFWIVMAACIMFASCSRLGPISLNRAVINYDSNVLKSEKELVLLNIVRMHDDQPSHFTVSGDIKATFTFSTTNGIFPTWNIPLAGSLGGTTNTLGLNLNATVSESPTITITPMEGKDFAARLLKPMDSVVANMVLSQKAIQIDKLLRLTGHSFLMIRPKDEGDEKWTDDYPKEVLEYLQKKYECFTKEGDRSCFLVNRPPIMGEEPAEKTERSYELFRQVVLQIKAIERTGHLQFFPLEFDQDIEGTFSTVKPTPKDMIDALDKQYRFTETDGPRKGFKLTKPYTILALSDFPLNKLDKATLKKIAKALELSDYIKLDQSVIIVLLREKTNWPIYGLFRLRNFTQVLQFLAESLNKDPGYHREYDVAPSRFTEALAPLQPGVFDNPPLTLEILSGKIPTREVAAAVDYNGESFWISSSQRWNRQVFNLLYEIFQMNRIEAPVSPTLVSIPK